MTGAGAQAVMQALCGTCLSAPCRCAPRQTTCGLLLNGKCGCTAYCGEYLQHRDSTAVVSDRMTFVASTSVPAEGLMRALDAAAVDLVRAFHGLTTKEREQLPESLFRAICALRAQVPVTGRRPELAAQRAPGRSGS